MNCLNSSEFLEEALDSVYSQTFVDWEIIFWDNASTDNSSAIAKSYDSKLRYFKSNKTVSLGEARNFAIKEARGEYIAFLDCDDKWLPEKLQKQVTILDVNKEVGFIYSNFFIQDNIRNCQRLALKSMQPQGRVFEKFLYNYPVGILTVLLRRKNLECLDHLFDASLNYAEDYDFFMRFIYETPAVYLKEPLAVYRIHQNMSSINLFSDVTKEHKYTIEKFKHIYKDFEKRYSKALRHLNERFEYFRIWKEMARGDLKAVRNHPEVIKTFNIKLLMLYFASFMPVKLWFMLWHFWSILKGNKNIKKLIVKSL